MNEKNKVFSEIIPQNKLNMQKTSAKTFIVELLIFNYIYENKIKQNEFTVPDKEKIELDIPITSKENSLNEFSLSVEDLTQQLKKKGYPISTSLIYIYNKEFGYSLLNNKDIIYSSYLSIKDTIKLKLENHLDNKLIDDTTTILKKCFDLNKTEFSQENSLNKENKQLTNNKRNRKIGDIVKIVYAQRKFFNGYYNDEGEKINCNLDEASKKVKEKRKTLDDYLKQLRDAREKEFDFNKNKDKPISDLRSFNEKNKKNKNLNLNTNINDNDNNIDNGDDINNEHENLLDLDEDNNNI
jgi:hypothetical protein